MLKIEIIKFLMGLVCILEKVGTVCKLFCILIHVFGRNSVDDGYFSILSSLGTEFP